MSRRFPIASVQHLLSLDPSGLQVNAIAVVEAAVVITLVAVAPSARCPRCNHPSDRSHSRYWRPLTDLPIRNLPVVLRVRARRFFCRRRDCTRRIFAERLPGVDARIRRTRRLRANLRDIALADGGEAGSRLAERLGVRASPSYLLRMIRQPEATTVPTPRVLGVDEWAKRKGRSYGTILVDLEERRVVDLLDEATAGAFTTWLQAHPGVEIISRDRGGAFAEGAREGAPDALQVADRWHLLKNLGDAVEAFLQRNHHRLPVAAPAEMSSPADVGPTLTSAQKASSSPGRLTCHEQERLRRHARRVDRYEAVRELIRQGLSIRAVARTLDLSRTTVHRYLRADTFPEMSPRRKRSSILDPHRAYLEQRWREGCHNGRDLLCELRERGYIGGPTVVADAVSALRRSTRVVDRVALAAAVERSSTRRASPRQVRWWFVRSKEELDGDDRAALERLLADQDDCRAVYDLAQRFGAIVRGRRRADLADWLADARRGPRELYGFAAGIERDRPAVEAALTELWSQGQTEGQINRLKLTKRKMFGRAKLDLLRRRVLEAV
jgi:transposase